MMPSLGSPEIYGRQMAQLAEEKMSQFVNLMDRFDTLDWSKIKNIVTVGIWDVSRTKEIIPKLHDESFDVVFTMAVLEHLSLESEFVFSHIIRITKNVILTIEDEFTCSSRHFPRNYRKIFEISGIKHLEINTNNIEGISSPNFHSRLFIKKPFT